MITWATLPHLPCPKLLSKQTPPEVNNTRWQCPPDSMLIWSIHRINGIKVAQVLWWWWSIATWTCGHIIGAKLDDCSVNVPNHSWYSVSVCSILFVVGGNDRPHQIQCLDRQAAEALMIVWWSGAPPSHWISVALWIWAHPSNSSKDSEDGYLFYFFGRRKPRPRWIWSLTVICNNINVSILCLCMDIIMWLFIHRGAHRLEAHDHDKRWMTMRNSQTQTHEID